MPSLEEVKSFFDASKDDATVAAFKQSLVTPDLVRSFLATDAGNEIVRSGSVSTVEKRVADAIKTFKDTHYADDLKTAIAAEREKMNPKETEAEKRLRELEEKDIRREKELAKEKLLRSVTEEATNEKVPTFWLKHFDGDSIEAAREMIADFKKVLGDVENKIRNEILTSGPKPGSGETPKPKNTEIMGKSLQELERMARESAKKRE